MGIRVFPKNETLGFINDYINQQHRGVVSCELHPTKGRILLLKKFARFGSRMFEEPPLVECQIDPENEICRRLCELCQKSGLEFDPIWHWCALCSVIVEGTHPDLVAMGIPTISEKTKSLLQVLHVPDTCIPEVTLMLDGLGLGALKSEEVEHMLQIWVYNSYEHPSNQDGLVIYFLPSFLSHSCTPNAIWCNSETDSFCLQAATDIDEGSEVTISYACEDYLVQPTNFRKGIMEKTKSFICSCERCVAKIDLSRGFACPMCEDGVIYPGPDDTADDLTVDTFLSYFRFDSMSIYWIGGAEVPLSIINERRKSCKPPRVFARDCEGCGKSKMNQIWSDNYEEKYLHCTVWTRAQMRSHSISESNRNRNLSNANFCCNNIETSMPEHFERRNSVVTCNETTCNMNECKTNLFLTNSHCSINGNGSAHTAPRKEGLLYNSTCTGPIAKFLLNHNPGECIVCGYSLPCVNFKWLLALERLLGDGCEQKGNDVTEWPTWKGRLINRFNKSGICLSVDSADVGNGVFCEGFSEFLGEANGDNDANTCCDGNRFWCEKPFPIICADASTGNKGYTHMDEELRGDKNSESRIVEAKNWNLLQSSERSVLGDLICSFLKHHWLRLSWFKFLASYSPVPLRLTLVDDIVWTQRNLFPVPNTALAWQLLEELHDKKWKDIGLTEIGLKVVAVTAYSECIFLLENLVGREHGFVAGVKESHSRIAEGLRYSLNMHIRKQTYAQKRKGDYNCIGELKDAISSANTNDEVHKNFPQKPGEGANCTSKTSSTTDFCETLDSYNFVLEGKRFPQRFIGLHSRIIHRSATETAILDGKYARNHQ